MEPLNGHGKLYFLRQGISLLSQNCSQTCEFTHLWLQHILEIIAIIKTQEKKPHESFTGSKPNVNRMHIFGTTCFCYVQNKKKLDPRCEKKASLSAMIN